VFCKTRWGSIQEKWLAKVRNPLLPSFAIPVGGAFWHGATHNHPVYIALRVIFRFSHSSRSERH